MKARKSRQERGLKSMILGTNLIHALADLVSLRAIELKSDLGLTF
jgi:hypothetical protein